MGKGEKIVVKAVLASSVFVDENEMNYVFHTYVDDVRYPQYHDFYEIVLVTSGRMEIIVNGISRMMHSGGIAILRPGDVHTKRDAGNAKHINLAFPAKTFERMFDYIGKPDDMERLIQHPSVPLVNLSPGETALLQMKMKQLALLPHQDTQHVNARLRVLLLECMVNWFIPSFQQNQQGVYPEWMTSLLSQLDDPANLAQGVEYLSKSSGLSPEHISRSFKRFLGISPRAYLNTKRLNYAANMLHHSDHSILDIAFEAGFTSESSFFRDFSKEFGMSPLKYRNAKRKYS